MKNGFRQSMAWLHTWSGLLVGWVLFLVFAAVSLTPFLFLGKLELSFLLYSLQFFYLL